MTFFGILDVSFTRLDPINIVPLSPILAFNLTHLILILP